MTFRRGGFLEDDEDEDEEVDAHALVQTLPTHEEEKEEETEDMSAKTKARLLSHARAVTRSLRDVCLRVERFVYVLKNKVRERDAFAQKRYLSLLSPKKQKKKKSERAEDDRPSRAFRVL